MSFSFCRAVSHNYDRFDEFDDFDIFICHTVLILNYTLSTAQAAARTHTAHASGSGTEAAHATSLARPAPRGSASTARPGAILSKFTARGGCVFSAYQVPAYICFSVKFAQAS